MSTTRRSFFGRVAALFAAPFVAKAAAPRIYGCSPGDDAFDDIATLDKMAEALKVKDADTGEWREIDAEIAKIAPFRTRSGIHWVKQSKAAKQYVRLRGEGGQLWTEQSDNPNGPWESVDD